MGLARSKVSGILRGDLRNVSERKLMDCLTRLGYDIEISMRPTKAKAGHLVLAAEPRWPCMPPNHGNVVCPRKNISHLPPGEIGSPQSTCPAFFEIALPLSLTLYPVG